jgi:Ca-activated chloride channel family protein
LITVDGQGKETTRRVSDLSPDVVPDLFEGDQLVLFGRYHGDDPLHFRLQGKFAGKTKAFRFDFSLKQATTRNAFVPRLWASRRIGRLVDEIRQAGADSGSDPAVLARAANDPKMKELVDEIVRLSFEFGILTEYTAFLAEEGSDLAQRDQILRQANENFVVRAQMTRGGIAAVNQGINNDFQQYQLAENRRNYYYDDHMNRVQVTQVQQINDRAFFQQGSRWIDGNAINSDGGTRTDQTVVFGSPEFMQLLDRLAVENRQGTLSMSGDILVRVDGKNILVTGK